jgi:hypothetical protein
MATINGFTDKHNTCDCCGKSELKGTYSVTINDNEFFYGSTCVKRNLGLNNTEFIAKQKADKAAKENAARIEFKSLTSELEKELSKYDWISDEKQFDAISNEIYKIKKSIQSKYNLKNF